MVPAKGYKMGKRISKVKCKNRRDVFRNHFQNSHKTYTNLTLEDPFISESCIEIKIELNFYFYTSLWCLKRFYEGL